MKPHSGGAKPQGKRYQPWRPKPVETKTEDHAAAQVAQQTERQPEIAALTNEPARADSASSRAVPERKRRRSAPVPTHPLYNARELREQLAAIGSPSRRHITNRTGLDATTLDVILLGQYKHAIAAPIRRLCEFAEMDAVIVFRPRLSSCRIKSKSAVLARSVKRRKRAAVSWFAEIRYLDGEGEERVLRRRVDSEEDGHLLLKLWTEEVETVGQVQTVPAPKPFVISKQSPFEQDRIAIDT